MHRDDYTITIARTAPSVGADITGVDLSQPISDAVFDDIHRALGEFGVVFFRDQNMDSNAHLAFSKRFGDISVNRFFQSVKGYPEIFNVAREPN